MLGFIIGTVCVIGLVKVLRRTRGYCGGRFGYGPYRAYGGRHGGPRWFMRSLFERLETTPGQEKAIVSAFEQLRENRHLIREEMQQTRADLARAVGSGWIDDHTLEESFARHDRVLAQLRVALVEALKTATEALDDRQRKQLAALIERGLRRARPWMDSDDGVWA